MQYYGILTAPTIFMNVVLPRTTELTVNTPTHNISTVIPDGNEVFELICVALTFPFKHVIMT